jgi:Spy/CpxP family protein refolding chaperone
MIRFIVSSLAAVVLLGAVAVQAGGDACCKAGKSAQAGGKGCDAALSQLKLTDEQQAKIATLKTECTQGEWTKESRAKFMKGVQGVLTAEQYTEFQSLCEKHAKGGVCPITGAHTQKDPKS